MSGSLLAVTAALTLSMTACSSSGSSTASAKTSTSSAAGPTTASTASTSASAGERGSASGSEASPSSSSESSDAAPTSTATPPAITNKTSDWVERSGFKLKVDVVTYPFQPPAGFPIQPASNQEYLKLHLELTNTGGQGAFSMMDMEVRDSADEEILPDVVTTDALPKNVRLDLLSLKPGEHQTGEVVFIAPKGAKGLRLVFKGTLMTADGQVNTSPPPVIDLGV